MDKPRNNEVSIDLDNVTLRFGEMEPVVIPRSAVRTRLRLIDCIYRLTGWPGMNVRRLRSFIEAIYRHHGWSPPDPTDDPLLENATHHGTELETANGGAHLFQRSESLKDSARLQLAA
ncbi:MAG: hypothetical protein ABIR29_14235 [Chthoniobacterales bacterium]